MLDNIIDGFKASLALIVGLLVGIVVGLLMSLLRAFVLRDLWNWFVSPLGVPDVGLLHAWGLVLAASLFSDQTAGWAVVLEKEDLAARIWWKTVTTWLGAWLVGALIVAAGPI
jgi:hypothetical protein